VNDLTTTTTKELAKTDNPIEFSNWEPERFDINNVIFPSLSCQQSMSKLYKKGKTKIGDIVDTATAEVFGNVLKGFTFIPFYNYSELHTMIGSKMVKRERLNEENSKLPREEVVRNSMGKEETLKRYEALVFFGLVPNKGKLPYCLTFRSTSYPSGKQLYTQMYVSNKLEGVLPCSYHMLIWSEEAPPKDGNTWNVIKVAVAQSGDGTPKKSNDEEIATCWNWLRTMKGKDIKVMDEENEAVE
jgi:hypothetical protein